jgi:hypothetical protein
MSVKRCIIDVIYIFTPVHYFMVYNIIFSNGNISKIHCIYLCKDNQLHFLKLHHLCNIMYSLEPSTK